MVLVLVLGVLAMALGICYAFTHVAMSSGQIAANLCRGQEAMSAAEAGIEEALYRLNADPSWPGAAWVLDGQGTQVRVSVSPAPADPWALRVESVGDVHGTAAAETPWDEAAPLASRTVTATFRRAMPAFSRYVVSAIGSDPGLVTHVALYVYRPSGGEEGKKGTTKVSGDIRSNGDVYLDWKVSVTGSVWATRQVQGSGRVKVEVYTDAGRLRRPVVDPALYRQYRLGNHVFSSQVLTGDSLPSGTYVPVASNPMGVLYREGSLVVDLAADIRGTLVVTDDLWLRSPRLKVRAHVTSGAGFGYDVDGDGVSDAIRFPALVVGGNVYVCGGETDVEVSGWLCSGGEVCRQLWADDSRFRVSGGIAASGVYAYTSRAAAFEAVYDPDGCDLRAAPGCFRWVVSGWQE